MPKAWPGIQTPVRVVAAGTAGGAEAGMGAGADGDGGMSQVVGDAAEFGVGGEISELEIRGIARRERVERAGCGCISDAREGMARWAARIH
jgi:hypothetical protein